MKNSLFFVVILCFSSICFSADDGSYYSGRNEIFDNPFISIGFDRERNNFVGYISALRTAPGNTDECKFIIKGSPSQKDRFSVDVFDVSGVQLPARKKIANIEVASEGYNLLISKNQLPLGCDWILSFVGEPAVYEKNGQFTLVIRPSVRGDWKSIGVAKAKKSYFYSYPDGKSMQKSYLVPGDLFYIYDQVPGWFYVKYQARKKLVGGWIREQDTFRILDPE